MINLKKTTIFALISSFAICNITYSKSAVLYTMTINNTIGPSIAINGIVNNVPSDNYEFLNNSALLNNNVDIYNKISNDTLDINISSISNITISTTSNIKTQTEINIANDNNITMPTYMINPTDTIYTHQGKKYIKGKSLGNFKLTGYCACKKCTSGTGITYSGKPVTDNHTVSADLSIIPLNTFIILENSGGTEPYKYDGVYQVEDKGGGVKNKHIDIYEPTHEEASNVSKGGIKYADIYEAIEIE